MWDDAPATTWRCPYLWLHPPQWSQETLGALISTPPLGHYHPLQVFSDVHHRCCMIIDKKGLLELQVDAGASNTFSSSQNWSQCATKTINIFHKTHRIFQHLHHLVLPVFCIPVSCSNIVLSCLYTQQCVVHMLLTHFFIRSSSDFVVEMTSHEDGPTLRDHDRNLVWKSVTSCDRLHNLT